MTAHGQWSEHATLYALGLLDPNDLAPFERHLAECEECRADVQVHRELAAEIALVACTERPSPDVRAQLLRRTAPAHVLVRAHEGTWEPTPFPGVELRQLFVDAATGNVTSLVRLAPGAKYPPHRHAGLEHCYVLEGDLVSDRHTIYAGDYEVNSPDTDHLPVSSTNGCLLLIINNQRDTLLA